MKVIDFASTILAPVNDCNQVIIPNQMSNVGLQAKRNLIQLLEQYHWYSAVANTNFEEGILSYCLTIDFYFIFYLFVVFSLITFAMKM